MADLVLSVDVSSLAEARRKLDGFQKAMNNLSVNRLASGVNSLQNSIRQLVEAQAKGTIGSNAYQKGLLELKRAYEQLGYSSQQATAAVRAYAAQLQRQRAAQEAARAAEELARAQAQAAARTRELRLRFQEGYAAFDRARKQMRDLREALRQGIITQDQYREALRRVREEQQRAGAGAGGLAGRMNRAGVITQQAGYQMGDFIVQVQSGTNWMVAFGQQATQVAGTLTLLGGKWLLIGSVLGVAIPLITAAGAAFMRTRGSAKTFSETLDELETAISNYKSAMEEASAETTELNVRFGSVSESMRPFLQDLKELERIKALNKLQEQFEKLEANSASFFERFGATFVGGGALQSELASQLGLTVDQYRELNAQVVKLKETENTAERIQAAENLRQIILASAGSVDNMTKEMRDFYENLLRVSLASGEVLGIVESTSEATNNALAAQYQYYADTRRESDELSRSMGEAFLAAQNLDNLTLEDGVSAAAQAALLLAQRLGVSLAAARGIMALERGRQMDVENLQNQYGAYGAGRVAGENLLRTSGELFGGTGNVLSGRGYYDSERRGGGGQDPLEQLHEQLRLEEELLRKSEAQQRVIRALGVDWRRYGEQTVNSLISSIEQMNEFNKQVEQQQELANTIETSMSDAFMSMVDGTKTASDAFKDMARSIIKQLYEVLVVQRLVGSFNASTGTGTGLVGAIMGAIPGNASGGYMSAGKPYIVGEHGPELVIPGRSGTVMNADLTNKAMGGGNPAPIVNLTYNFQGGVTEADLSRALPVLVERTKREVVDAVQRGGSVARVFR